MTDASGVKCFKFCYGSIYYYRMSSCFVIDGNNSNNLLFIVIQRMHFLAVKLLKTAQKCQ